MTEIKSLKNRIEPWKYLIQQVEDTQTLYDLAEESGDASLESEIANEFEKIKQEFERLSILNLLSDEVDRNGAFLTIHAGAGGTEACDWAQMLCRMYTRWAENKGYKIEVVDILESEGGIKSVTLQISGDYVFGYLKSEAGVHRLVRISPFDSNKRRHTSFASVEITPKFDNNIDIVINESDLRVDIYRSSGPGGQGVNTTDSAVRITHIPTGIVVTCQNERSQIRNKETAMAILKSKLYNLEVMKKNNQINNLKGDQMTIGFGSAKRSYVMCPYTLVKDSESGYETSNVSKILDGDIGEMLEKNIRR